MASYHSSKIDESMAEVAEVDDEKENELKEA